LAYLDVNVTLGCPALELCCYRAAELAELDRLGA
jgi:hypothetical protein